MTKKNRNPRIDRDECLELERITEFMQNPTNGNTWATGEHFFLISVLNGFGYHPNSRQQAFDLAHELIDEFHALSYK